MKIDEERSSTATSRARWAMRVLPTASELAELPGAAEDRPSAATRHVERMRRRREAAAREERRRPGMMARIVVAMLVLEGAKDEAEKVARRIRDEKDVSDLVEREADLRRKIADVIRQREELEAAMRDGTTPRSIRPERRRALELLADSGYDVCVACGYFDAERPDAPPMCPGCGAKGSTGT